jgi:hypothetical protein
MSETPEKNGGKLGEGKSATDVQDFQIKERGSAFKKYKSPILGGRKSPEGFAGSIKRE